MQCWIGTWIGYSAVLVIGALAIRAATTGEKGTLVASLGDQTAKINIATQALSQIEKEFQDTARDLAMSRAIGNQPDWSILLTLLSDQLPDSMWLERCDLKPMKPPAPVLTTTPRDTANAKPVPGREDTSPRGFVLVLGGQAATQTDVGRFVLGLEGTELFAKVTLVETRNQPNPIGEAVGFHVECLLEARGEDR